MTKRLLLAFVQFAAFCGLFYVGGYWAWIRLSLEMRAMQNQSSPPPLLPLWKMHVTPTLDYVLNGVVFAGVLLIVILLVQALRGRLRRNAVLTLGGFVLAFLLSIIFHSGFVPVTPS